MALSALALVLLSGAVQEPAPPPPPHLRERRICRTQQRLGTILPRRICRSASDWAAIDGAQEKITDRDTAHMRNNGRSSLRETAGD